MNLNDLVKKNRWAEIAEVLQLVSFENEHERSGPDELMMMMMVVVAMMMMMII